MPEMIPKPFRGDVSSERKVYSYLEGCKFKGYAIHSVSFQSPNMHEADFIVITHRGVLVLEVKGGEVSWSRQDDWTSTDKLNVKNKLKLSPYKQAFYNQTAIMDKLRKDLPSINVERTLFAYGVVFPDNFDLPQTVEAVPQVTFTGSDEPSSFDSYVNRCFDYALSKMDLTNHSGGFPMLDEKAISALKVYLCGYSGIIRDLRKDIRATEEKMLAATEAQFKLLRIIRDIDRFTVKGGAGTGKTLIALEHAERLANSGLRVLFLTYNKLLKQFLKKQARCEGVDFINFDSLIYNSLYPNDDTANEERTWASMSVEQSRLECNQIRPNAFIKRGGPAGSLRYDAVVVDEAQDILDLTRKLQCVDLMVKGGLAKGKVAFFYDASQHIFSTGEPDELQESLDILKNTYNYPSLTLEENCRNTVQIAEFTRLATGFGDPAGNTSISSASSVDVLYYSDSEEKIERLCGVLKDLKGQGIEGKDILVLSHRGAGNEKSSLAHSEKIECFYRTKVLNPDEEYENEPDVVKMSNIYSYKGLQENIVIVTDVEKLEGDCGRKQRENYACFSRAKAKLYVIADAGLKPRLDEIVEKTK